MYKVLNGNIFLYSSSIFYQAMRAFDDIMNDPKNHIRLKMQPGDMVTVKNQRVLHGRSELEGGVSGRHLQCGYMDWDEIRSELFLYVNNIIY